MSDKIIKNKCDMLLKHIFGSNFYFVHGTKYWKTEPILKSGYINISHEIDKKYWSLYSYDNPAEPIEGLNHTYCWVKYDDIEVKLNEGYDSNFLIDPRILLYEDVIFNTAWSGGPIERKETDPGAIRIYKNIKLEEWTEYNFSIHLNKSDSKEERLKKLQKIKKYIQLIRESELKSLKYSSYFMSHEFLFPSKINLKKYLIGIAVNGVFTKEKHIKKILKKKYKHVKIYEKYRDSNYPTLIDVIC